MHIVISNFDTAPIYEQIKTQIKAAILNGEVAQGEQLPSIRQLAKDLKISVITTTRAYSDLEEEGFVKNVQGRGCFVAPRNNELLRESALRGIEESLFAAITLAKNAGIEKDDLLNIINILSQEEDYE